MVLEIAQQLLYNLLKLNKIILFTSYLKIKGFAGSSQVDKKSKIYTSGGETKNNKEFHFNRASFIHNLLLFDEVIVHSPKLQEIEELIKLLGIDVTIELLNSKSIKFDHSLSAIGSMGLEHMATKSWCHISGKIIHLAELAELRERKLEQLRNKYNIPKIKFKALERSFNDALFPNNLNRYSEALRLTEAIFIAERTFLKNRIKKLLKRDFNKEVAIEDIEIETRKVGADLILFESNVCNVADVSPNISFKLIQNSFLEISRPFATAEIANEADASVTLSTQETEKLNSDLVGMLKGQTEPNEQKNLIRILNVAGLPSFDDNFAEIKFDKIFQLRDSAEIKEFRDWNKRLENKSDEEVNDMFNSTRAKIAEVFNNPVGKILRIGFATTLSPAVGLGWALSEAFVVEQLLKRNALVAFVNDELSSILPIHSI